MQRHMPVSAAEPAAGTKRKGDSSHAHTHSVGSAHKLQLETNGSMCTHARRKHGRGHWNTSMSVEHNPNGARRSSASVLHREAQRIIVRIGNSRVCPKHAHACSDTHRKTQSIMVQEHAKVCTLCGTKTLKSLNKHEKSGNRDVLCMSKDRREAVRCKCG
jgi:hypothetical protein